MIKLWGRINSVNVEKVAWCLVELGLPFERIDAGGAFGMLDTPHFRALNPAGRIPVLEDEGVVLSESNTIVRYLCAKYGDGTLLPQTLEARAEAERWMDFQLGTLAPAFVPVFWGLVRTRPEARDMAAITKAYEDVNRALAVADAALAGRDYLVGASFTMADIPLGAVANRWVKLPIEGTGLEPPELANLTAWHKRLLARPAAAEFLSAPLT